MPASLVTYCPRKRMKPPAFGLGPDPLSDAFAYPHLNATELAEVPLSVNRCSFEKDQELFFFLPSAGLSVQ